MSPFKFLATVDPEPQTDGPAHVRPTTGSGATQFIQFLISGGSATLAHWAVMAWLLWGGAQALPSTIIGALVGSLLNYCLQFHWTFSGTGTHRKAIPAYAGTVVFGWCVNAGLFYFLTSIAHAGNGLAQVCTSGTVAVINFILYKRLVFNERTD